MRSCLPILVVGFCGWLATACGGPNVGEILGQEVTLDVLATTSAPDVAAIGDSRGGLGVSQAFVNAKSITLVPCEQPDAGITIDPRAYDLLSTPPLAENVTTAVSDFCTLTLDVASAADGGSEDAPGGAAFYVAGSDADDKPLELSSSEAASLVLRSETGASFGDQPLLLGFDLGVWLAGNVTAADADPASLAAQFADSVALYVDENGNHALDDDERAPVAHVLPSR